MDCIETRPNRATNQLSPYGLSFDLLALNSRDGRPLDLLCFVIILLVTSIFGHQTLSHLYIEGDCLCACKMGIWGSFSPNQAWFSRLWMLQRVRMLLGTLKLTGSLQGVWYLQRVLKMHRAKPGTPASSPMKFLFTVRARVATTPRRTWASASSPSTACSSPPSPTSTGPRSGPTATLKLKPSNKTCCCCCFKNQLLAQNDKFSSIPV